MDQTDRVAQLESLLTDANLQLLERDEETLGILAVRDEELARAHAQIERLDRELDRHAHDVAALNTAIAEMQGTRAWRVAVRVRELRARVRQALGSTKA